MARVLAGLALGLLFATTARASEPQRSLLSFRVVPGGDQILQLPPGLQVINQKHFPVGVFYLHPPAEGPIRYRILRPPFDNFEFTVEWSPQHGAWVQHQPTGDETVSDKTVFYLHRTMRFRTVPAVQALLETPAGLTPLEPVQGGFSVPASTGPDVLYLAATGFKSQVVALNPDVLSGPADRYPDHTLYLVPWFGPFSYWQFDVAAAALGAVGVLARRVRRRPPETPAAAVELVPQRPGTAPPDPAPKLVTTTFLRFLKSMGEPKMPPMPSPDVAPQYAAPTTLMAAVRPPLTGDVLGPEFSWLAEHPLQGASGWRYRLVGVHGPGAGALVLEAATRTNAGESPVRLKLLLNTPLANPAALEVFQQQAQDLATLRDPNIAWVVDWGVAVHPTSYVRIPFIVNEGVAFSTLRHALDRTAGPQPVPRASSIAAATLTALEACHQRHRLHGHIKPENLLVDDQGGVKVLDVGLAGGHSPSYYCAPEAFTGGRPEPSFDVYSVGAVLYEMLTGQAPFGADAATRIPRGDYIPLAVADPKLPARLCEVVQAMMALHVPDRLQTAAGARTVLLAVLQS